MPFASSAEELAAQREPDLRRSRSHGHGNFWEQQQTRERYERELQLQPGYHHRHRSGPSLTVPSIPYGWHQTGRVQYRDEWEEEDSYVRQPSHASQSYDRKMDNDTTLGYKTQVRVPTTPKSTDLPIRTRSQRRPSIKVEIHQDQPPKEFLPSRPSPSRTFSPPSGASLVDIRFNFDSVVRKLTDVSALCSRKCDADTVVDGSKSLSFSGIAARLNGDVFRLSIWSYEVGLEKCTEIDSNREKAVETSLRTMQRISDRATDLSTLCVRAQYRDLKLPFIEPERHCEDYSSDDEEEREDGDVEDPTESLGFEIKACLDSISLQIQTLSKMTRTLQDATCPNGVVNEEVEAIGELVAEVNDFFGSQDALRKHSINEKFAGRKALEEARYTTVRR